MNRWMLPTCLMTLVLNASAFDLNSLDAAKVASGGAGALKAATPLSDAEELELGKDVAARMVSKYGQVQDAPLNAYVQTVGLAVAKHTSRPGVTYHFAVLQSAEINAFAAPGGFIFVTQGLLDFLKDESELAGVLGHEITHVTKRHVVKQIQKAHLLSAGADLASSAGGNQAAKELAAKFTVELLGKGLSRQDELEADSLGIVLASKAGYAAQGMKDALARLEKMEGKSSVVDHFERTHPPAKDRLTVVERSIASNHLPPTGKREKRHFEMEVKKA